ncbi:MAG: hypothetical protein ACTSQJ_19625 [Promethearchaeota archaeon]
MRLLSRSIQYKLTKAQEHLTRAKELIEQNYTTYGLIHDLIAKAMVQVSEFQTELFNRIGFISDADSDFIVPVLREIRNNIVLLLGNSANDPRGQDISDIIIYLYALNDYIKEEIGFLNRICLTNKIYSAINQLELAIFLLSQEKDIEFALINAQAKLEQVKDKVEFLESRGKISEDLAIILIAEIQTAQNAIEVL